MSGTDKSGVNESVGVIIPTLNAQRYLERLLAALARQTVPNKVVVIDSSSTDDTVLIAGDNKARTIVIKRGEFDHGGTRNIGAKESDGSIIAFITQDALPADEFYLENLIKPLTDPVVAASYGRQLARDNATPVELFARNFNYPDKPEIKGLDDAERLGIKTFFLSNVCSAFRRKEFAEAGGFPEKTIINEDMILAAKLVLRGYRIAYVPTARVSHSHNYSLVEQMKRYFDIGVSMAENPFILKYGKAGGEGSRFVKDELGYLIGEGRYGWAAYAVLEALFKYSGFKSGLNYRLIPNGLRKIISMHSYHWDDIG